MSYDLTPLQITILAVGAVLGHVALFLASRKVNPLYVLAAVVLVLAPFSAAPGFIGGMLVKWIRGYALALLLLVGILKHHRGSLGGASQIWLGFIALYIFAGLWCPVPPRALAYKGQLGLVVLAGIFLVSSVRDHKELWGGLRCLSLAAGAMGLFMFGVFAVNPQASLEWGRLNIMGSTATRIAMNLGAMLLICTYLALNERSTFWKAAAFCACGALTMVMILTGSRGSSAAVVLGFMVQVLPQSGHRLRMLMLPVFMACVAFVAIDTVGGEVNVARFVSTENTRAELWGKIPHLIAEKPLFGHGWIYLEERASTIAMHSIYLQVAVEVGLLGLVVLGVCLVALARRGLHTFRFLRRQRTLANMGILPLSIIAAVLFDGLVSTDSFNPSSLAMMMAMAVALIDRLPQFAIAEKRRTLRMVVYETARRGLLAPRRIAGLGTAE